MRRLSWFFFLLSLGFLTALAQGQNFKTIEVYNVLDAGNDNTGGITKNNATGGNLGNTTGQERGLAVRVRAGEPTIVYIARGGILTGDGRSGGVVGIAAIKLQAKTDSDFNPNTTPDLPLNYIDTGLIVSGGSPSSFSFVQGITYEPVLDKVWLLDGTSATPRVWYFEGGSTGGAENGGDVARTAIARGIASPFQADNTSGLGGRGQALAVRVDPVDKRKITVALAMGNHLEVWESTTGLEGPWSPKFESSNDPDGSGPVPAFGSSSVRDVAFDEQGDIWVTSQQAGSSNFLHRYDGDSTGTGIASSDNPDLPAPPFVLQPNVFAQGFNSIKFYKQGDSIFLIAVNRSSDDSKITVVRYRRTGERGAYTFTALDGFGSNVAVGENQDATLSTLRLKGTASETQPGGSSPNGLMYLLLPYSSTGDLTLSEPALYLNGFVVDGSKNQTLPTSGVVRVSFAPAGE